MFRYGCAEGEKASPDARWHIDVGDDGPDDYKPDDVLDKACVIVGPTECAKY